MSAVDAGMTAKHYFVRWLGVKPVESLDKTVAADLSTELLRTDQ